MKQILTAIDFSPESIRSLEFSIGLANRTGAGLTLVWVDHQTDRESIYENVKNELRNQARDQFEELVDQYAKKIHSGRIFYKLRKGKIYQEVSQQALLSEADIIVAGTHGVSGYEEGWIGSNAYRIVSHSPCPVITVRHDADADARIDSVVMPVDSTLETLHKLPFTLRFAADMEAVLHIAAMMTVPTKSLRTKIESYSRKAAGEARKAGITAVITPVETDNIVKGVIEHATNVGAQLISIMTEQGNPGSNILGPFARQVVNDSPMPVLSIQPKK
ncbi:MAG: universal stress protein [Bacteroidales bacterium]|jgi:nucleotide-binding universal stress UspA family protein|nr:universal stress protein [Bacteroidales bacterium]